MAHYQQGYMVSSAKERGKRANHASPPAIRVLIGGSNLHRFPFPLLSEIIHVYMFVLVPTSLYTSIFASLFAGDDLYWSNSLLGIETVLI